MQSIKTNFEFPRGDDPIKQGQRLAQDLSTNFKAIKNIADSIQAPYQYGTAIMSGGVAVVTNSKVTNTSIILLTSQVDSGTIGFIRVSTRSAGVSFTIQSSSGADSSTVGWVIIEPK